MVSPTSAEHLVQLLVHEFTPSVGMELDHIPTVSRVRPSAPVDDHRCRIALVTEERHEAELAPFVEENEEIPRASQTLDGQRTGDIGVNSREDVLCDWCELQV